MHVVIYYKRQFCFVWDWLAAAVPPAAAAAALPIVRDRKQHVLLEHKLQLQLRPGIEKQHAKL